MISFKGRHFEKTIILMVVRWYVAYSLSYRNIEELMKECGLCFLTIYIRQLKYLNNIVEQDHRNIKRITKPMLGFKSFAAAEATIAGIELHHMLVKGQMFCGPNMPVWEQFYALGG